MALKLGNRARMTVASAPGTGPIALGSAAPLSQTFAAAGLADGDTCPYALEDGTAWEIGIGTYSATGPTLARSLVASSTGSLITASASAQVFISPLTSTFTDLVANSVTAGSVTASSGFVAQTGGIQTAGLSQFNGPVLFASTVTGSGVANSTTFLANTAAIILTPRAVWDSGVEATPAFSASMTLDFAQGINFSLTATGNFTLTNPSNAKPGQSGRIVVTQDATGSRTIAYGSAWKKGTAENSSLSTAAGTVDVIYYDVRSPTNILYSVKKAIA